MSEQTHIAAAEDQLVQQERAALEFFFNELGVDESQPHLRYLVDSMLWLNFEGVSKLEPFLSKSKGELNSIRDNPHKRFSKAAKKGSSSGESTYLLMDSYRENALRDRFVLNQLMIPLKDGEFIANANLLEGDHEAIKVLGDNLMRLEFLNNQEWPASDTRKFKERQQFWHGAAVAAAHYAGPSTLAPMLTTLWEQSGNRLTYWTDKVTKIAKTKIGKTVVASLEKKADEPQDIEITTDSETLKDQGPSEAEKKSKATDFEMMIPQEVRAYVQRRKAEYGEMAERLDDQGMPQHVKNERLWEEFPEFMPVEVSDYRDSKEIVQRVIQRSGSIHASRPNTDNLRSAVRRSPAFDHEDDPSNPHHF